MNTTGKVVWITGASSGIGEALAKEFNAKGAKLILSSRNENELKRVQSEFTNKAVPSAIVAFDIQKYNDLEPIAKQAIGAFGKVDVLINNAGISQRSLAAETALKDDLKILEIDLIGTIALTKAILPHMIENTGSQIVIISSVMGKVNTKYRTSYAAAKHGLIGYFDCLRLELEGIVDVCNIMPGFIATNIVKNAVSNTYNPNNANAAGMSADDFAKKAVVAINNREKNVYIGGMKEKFAMIMKRISPALYDRLIKNMKVV